ncbi:MAG: serine/threonine protein kinase [Pirellulales bacterium]|nr:serine/threonine protein kinase [Pirellulales bacterium]
MSTPPPKSAKPAADADLSGRQLGDFQLLRRLGRGAMAEVYLAEQCSLKRRVAMKILRAEFAGDPTYLQRFEIEAQAAASLVHANIVQIYEVGHIEQWHYIAQEYVQGQNLQDWLARNGPPDVPHALSIMRQVASALAKAAEVGVVHRDIKPENIMLTTSGDVKVADFGLARLTRDNESNQLTQVGITLGTPLYMSPEQVEGKPLDPRSDIYSFGVTCYHMLVGSPPFSGETALAVAVQHLKTQPKPLEAIRPDLPPALCRLVHSMLVKSPDRRCASAREIVREVRRVQLEYGGEDLPEDLPGWDSLSGEYPADPRIAATRQLGELMKTLAMQQPKRRRWWRYAVGFACAFLVGGAIAWFALAERSLLAGAAETAPSFPTAETAEQQYLSACRFGTEEAWKSVIQHFSDNQLYSGLAREQLVLLYLDKKDTGRALSYCGELIGMGGDWPDYVAFGWAGRSVAYAYDRDNGKSEQALNQYSKLEADLKNPLMKQLVDIVRTKNRPTREKLVPSLEGEAGNKTPESPPPE